MNQAAGNPLTHSTTTRPEPLALAHTAHRRAVYRAIAARWRSVRPSATVGLTLFALVLACRELPSALTDVDPTSCPPAKTVKVASPRDPPETPVRVPIPIMADDSGRWLSILSVKDGAAGAWATGSFKAKRNRLDIRTKEVQTFTLDTNRIPIRWDKPVVMNINGRTGELRRREYTLLHFALDGRGDWIVVEP